MTHQPLVRDTSELRATEVVASLDSEVSPGKNIVWCSSFQLVWNELRDKLMGGPVRLDGNQVLADRLNRSAITWADVDPESVSTSIDIEPADPDKGRMSGSLAITASIKVNMPFEIHFNEYRDAHLFTDSNGVVTDVTSFGIRPEDEDAFGKLRCQIEVMYDPQKMDRMKASNPFECSYPEYVIDLFCGDDPYQILLAQVYPQKTLARTIDNVVQRMDIYPKDRYWFKWIEMYGVLLIPNISMRLTHRFPELEGAEIHKESGDRLPISTAQQVIDFTLDRFGAQVESDAKCKVIGLGGGDYRFDQPFLIYLRKRDRDHPFFVAWIDNAELLQKRQQAPLESMDS